MEPMEDHDAIYVVGINLSLKDRYGGEEIQQVTIEDEDKRPAII